jgi:di/tricarboxylate transporter
LIGETILLFGCGIALGTLLDETELATVVGKGMADALGVTSIGSGMVPLTKMIRSGFIGLALITIGSA